MVNIMHPGVIVNHTHLQFYKSVLPLTPGSKVDLTNKATYPVNCKYGSWGSWSDCSQSCGHGMEFRMREIISLPKRGGADCSSLFDSRDCIGPCKSKTNLTVLIIVVVVIAVIVSIVLAWYCGRKTAYII